MKYREMQYLIVLFEMLSQNVLRIMLTYVHPIVVSFMHERKQFTIKGVTFKCNDNKLLIKSAYGKIVGEIQGLSGVSPRKSLIIESNDPSLILKIQSEVTLALAELVHIIRQLKHGPGEYEPILMAATDNSTKNFIKTLKPTVLSSPVLRPVAKYSNE